MLELGHGPYPGVPQVVLTVSKINKISSCAIC
jgi:hypothetical protein